SASNWRINLDEIHVEPLFNLTLDILKHHTLYNALTLITDAPDIYMQQFWYTVYQNKNTKTYYFHLDYQQFEIGDELFPRALQTSPKQPNQPFIKPSSKDKLVNFIKELGYEGPLGTISQVMVNKLHQPWRTFLSIINKCLTRKSLGVDISWEALVKIIWSPVKNANINVPKQKKKADIPRRPRTITIADNLLEDPSQAIDLDASINFEEKKHREKE
ncbi:hypothetical protein Tco_1051658, partial [Tanacetum coccineum]